MSEGEKERERKYNVEWLLQIVVVVYFISRLCSLKNILKIVNRLDFLACVEPQIKGKEFNWNSFDYMTWASMWKFCVCVFFFYYKLKGWMAGRDMFIHVCVQILNLIKSIKILKSTYVLYSIA